MKYSLGSISDYGDSFYDRETLCLCPAKRERVLRFRNVSDRRLSILGDHIARKLVSDLLGITPEEVLIEPDISGRPVIARPEGTGLYCSISHSGEISCAAVSDRPVGIDIEQIRPYDSKVAEAVCSSGELSYIRENGDEGFYRIWTAKESYLKCIGTGLPGTDDLKKIDAFNLPGGITCSTDMSHPGYVISLSQKS